MRSLIALALVLAAAPAWADGTMHHDGAMHQHGHESAPAAAAKPARVVAVTMGDMSFTPASLSVAQGETIRFEIRNTSAVDHDFTLGDAATQAAHRQEMAAGHAHAHGHAAANAVMVPAGQTATLAWTFDQPGKLEYNCNVPGHFESGMAGVIEVKPAR
jgi:uncharacterized cupredoxin-like copper-binding protein